MTDDSFFRTVNCVIGILLVLGAMSFVGVIGKGKIRHERNFASYKRDGVIEVTGSNIHKLQSEFHNLSSSATWIHTGTNKWEIHLSNANKKYHQQEIIDNINNDA